MQSLRRSLSGSISFLELFRRSFSSRSRGINPEGDNRNSSTPPVIPALSLNELEGGSGANYTERSLSMSQRARPIIVADLGFPPNPSEPAQFPAMIDLENSLDEELKLDPVIANSKYESSPFIPFDHREIQSRESPDNSHPQPRYDSMIFFDPEENTKSSSDPKDQRRKKFLTVISANSISPHASPSTSPSNQTDISATVIQNTYRESLIKMKFILLEIENLRYDKNEIIEACQYARQFKGIMNGRDGVIGELRNKYSALDENKIKEKFERLKTISSLFQQKCFKKDIFSGRDENSLKSQYKFANGKNNRPGLRLAYIPDEALEMYERHNEAAAVELSARPVAARMCTPRQMI